jgi:hypothetical protein
MKNRIAKPSFLCIDDDKQLVSLCEAIEIHGRVNLTPEPPPPTWEEAIDEITKRLASQQFDGLLLDFRLDEYPTGTKNIKVRYTAESLVNELRRQSVEGTDRSYPIILWSTAENLSWYFSINPSYTGLYDGIWDKAIAREHAPEYAKKLESLAKGYRKLHVAAKKGQPLHTVLNCSATAVVAEMEQAFTAKIKQAPYAFNYATFIINRILRFNGVLIDRATVSAILGVADSESVDSVLRKLATKQVPVLYTGVFDESDERFWREDLITRLNQQLSGGHWLHLEAKERVAILARKLRLKSLRPAKAIYDGYQTDFDCVCAHTRRPLARRNGYRLRAPLLDPWIEPNYIAGTVYRTLSQRDAGRLRLDTGEIERFNADFKK